MSRSERAIERLLYEYAECVDRADHAGIGLLFARGEIRAGGGGEPLRGSETIAGFYASTNRVHEGGTGLTQHVVSNVVVEVDEAAGRARARSKYVVYQATPRLPLQPIVAGRYEDRFARDAEGWYFTERRIHVDLVGDVSEHLGFGLRPDSAARDTGAHPRARRGAFAGWSLVGWAALVLGLMELAILFVAGTGEDGVRMGIRATARTSAALFSLAFAASGLRRLWRSPLSAWLLRNRRYLGVSFAVSHLYHAVGIAAFRIGWPEAFVSDVPLSTVIGGGIGYVFVAAMAATSSDRAFRWLGRRRWRQLHWTGSWVIWVVFFAVYGPSAGVGWLPLFFALLLLAVAGLRIHVRLTSRRRPAAAAALAVLVASTALADARAESALRLRPPASLETGLALVYDSEGVPVGHSRIEFEWVLGRLHVEVNTVLESGEHSEFALGLESVGEGYMRPVWQRTRSYDAEGELAVEALVDHGRARAICRHDGDLRVVELPSPDRVANVPLDLVLDPLAGGSVDEVRFQFLYCRGFARLFDAFARRRAVLEDVAGQGAVAEIEVGFDLGAILSVVLKPVLPRIQLWMVGDSPARWLGHRMPLVPRGPTLLVLREGVPPALFQRRK